MDYKKIVYSIVEISDYDKSKLKTIGISFSGSTLTLTGIKSKKVAGAAIFTQIKSINLIKSLDSETDVLGFFSWLSMLKYGGSNSFADDPIYVIKVTLNDGEKFQAKVLRFDKIGVTKAIKRLNEKLK